MYLSVAARLCPSYCTDMHGWLKRWAERLAPGWANQVAAIVRAIQAHPYSTGR
jgi:hypothetical protein